MEYVPWSTVTDVLSQLGELWPTPHSFAVEATSVTPTAPTVSFVRTDFVWSVFLTPTLVSVTAVAAGGGETVGVYVVETTCPASSATTYFTGTAVPVKEAVGVKVTVVPESVYVPWVAPEVGSTTVTDVALQFVAV
jgi:hypothetical protein